MRSYTVMFDSVVVGAGPAGLAAAKTAAENGAEMTGGGDERMESCLCRRFCTA